MKRILSFLIAVLVLMISFLPCADAKALPSNESVQITNTQEPAPLSEHNDFCPPFCQCNCCSNVSINHYLHTGLSSFVPYPNNFAFIPLQAIQKLSFPVWQPPQLKA